MKKLTLSIILILLTGCESSVLYRSTVEFSVDCQQMLGRVGNTCKIKVPESSYVNIDGDTINVEYRP